MSTKSFYAFAGTLLLLALLPLQASAAGGGVWEASVGLSYNRSEYHGGSFSWNRRWGTSLGYNFSDSSQLEVSFQDVVDHSKFVDFEESNYHDRIYSANWVQSLFGKKYAIQPYFKVGIGQLNRRATVSDTRGRTSESTVDSLTGVLGVGMRIHLTRTFAIRFEATSYLSGGHIDSWKDNIAATVGASIYF